MSKVWLCAIVVLSWSPGVELAAQQLCTTVNVPFQNKFAGNVGAAVNGASYATPGALTAGGIFSIFGDVSAYAFPLDSVVPPGSVLPVTKAGRTLWANGVPIPLFYVSDSQINAQFPVEFAGLTHVTLQVLHWLGTYCYTTPPVTVTVVPFSPGIFTWNQTGRGPGAIVRDGDFSRICPAVQSDPSCRPNPTKPGNVVDVYATGLGPVVGSWATNKAATQPLPTVATPTVAIGGIPATVLFSGLAPGFVGLYQVNVIVPEGAATGDSVPLTLSIGGYSSNTVTIAIQSSP